MVGLHKSYAMDDLISDSAAGATAIACGVKTYNGAIGVGLDSMPVTSILEYAEAKGMATGVISNSTLVHATAASFYAHVKSRHMYEQIAQGLLKVEIDFFLGGGKKYFDNRKSDNRDLYEELRTAGYHISDYSKEHFNAKSPYQNKNFGYFTAEESPSSITTRKEDYLLPATYIAPRFLKKHSDNEGFFLMIEGSKIDWQGSGNDNSALVLDEMKTFDEAIGAALQFAKSDGETLLIVTSDHEAAPMAINPGSTSDKLIAGFSSSAQTGSLVPVFAIGPAAELFAGIYENTEIHHKMKRALNLGSKR